MSTVTSFTRSPLVESLIDCPAAIWNGADGVGSVAGEVLGELEIRFKVGGAVGGVLGATPRREQSESWAKFATGSHDPTVLVLVVQVPALSLTFAEKLKPARLLLQ